MSSLLNFGSFDSSSNISFPSIFPFVLATLLHGISLSHSYGKSITCALLFNWMCVASSFLSMYHWVGPILDRYQSHP